MLPFSNNDLPCLSGEPISNRHYLKRPFHFDYVPGIHCLYQTIYYCYINNKLRGSIYDCSKTSNDVPCRDIDRGESTREEVGCDGNEDVKMDVWSHKAGQNKE